MDEKIYKLVMIRRKTRLYYELPEQERSRLHAQVEQVRADVGAKLVSDVYDCMWSNEQVSEFYIVEYPNAQAVFEEMDCLEKICYPQYFRADYLLGKPSPWSPEASPHRQPVSKLVLLSDEEESYLRLPEEEKKQVWDQVSRNCAQVGVSVDADWYNCLATSGRYGGFGIMHYPDIQALVKEVQLSEGLLSYWHAKVIVGVRAEA